MDKALGLDLGKKTLGIAHNDSLGFVHGIETYRFKAFDYDNAANYANKVATERGINIIVIGLPLHLSGQMSDMSRNVMTFKDKLNALNPSLKIELVDERFSSVIANNTLSALNVSHEKRKETVDTVAACEILETYIRMKK